MKSWRPCLTVCSPRATASCCAASAGAGIAACSPHLANKHALDPASYRERYGLAISACLEAEDVQQKRVANGKGALGLRPGAPGGMPADPDDQRRASCEDAEARRISSAPSTRRPPPSTASRGEHWSARSNPTAPLAGATSMELAERNIAEYAVRS